MTYTITNKINDQQKKVSRDYIINLIDGFIAFNPTRKRLITDADKIAYYNRRSYYTVTEVK